MSFYDKFPTRNRTFNRDPSNHSKFVQDLRKELENDREHNRTMFDFDQDFNNFFPSRPNLRSRFGQHHPGFFTRNFEGPHSSSGASTASSADSSGNSSSGERERVIPIHVCTDNDESHKDQSSSKPSTGDSAASTASSSSSSSSTSKQQPQQQTDCSNSNQKSYSTQRNNTAEMPRVKELQRNQRAQSAPPDPTPHVNMTECGGGQSKKSSNIRTIPIQVESGGARPQSRSQHQQRQQQPQQQQQGTRHEHSNSGNDGHQPQPPKKPILDPLQKINVVAEQVKELAEKVNKFNGSNGKTKEYLYLDEMLTRLLIQLDDVEVEGRDDIRQARRECIKTIQKCINDLEVKLQLENNTAPNNSNGQEGGEGDSSARMEQDSNSGEGETKSNEMIPETNNSNNVGEEKNPVVPMSIDETTASNGAGNQGQGDQQLLLEKSSSSSNINNTVKDSKKEENINEEPKPPQTNDNDKTGTS